MIGRRLSWSRGGLAQPELCTQFIQQSIWFEIVHKRGFTDGMEASDGATDANHAMTDKGLCQRRVARESVFNRRFQVDHLLALPLRQYWLLRGNAL
jgi:hypothetical protein